MSEQRDSASRVLYFTKGLDDVVEAEVRERAPHGKLQLEERFAIVDAGQDPCSRAGLEELRTVDDMRTLVAGPAEITDEQAFAELCEKAAGQTVRQLESGDPRDPDAEPWSVTISARRPLWKRKQAWTPAPIVTEHLHGADVAGTRRQLIDLRIQADNDMMHVSLNRPTPLRAAEQAGPARPGALRRTVAAALVQIALRGIDSEISQRGLYDPFAGTGTIVAEAALLGLPVFASDIDPEAVALCRQRLADVPPTRRVDPDELLHRVFVHDVHDGMPSRVTAPLIVTNMPWGKQVRIERLLGLLDALAALAVQALDRGGAFVLLTANEQQFTARLRRQRADAHVRTRRIGLLGHTPTIVHAAHHDS